MSGWLVEMSAAKAGLKCITPTYGELFAMILLIMMTPPSSVECWDISKTYVSHSKLFL